MIKHVALAKYKDHAEGCTKEENLKKGKAMAEALAEKIPQIKKVEAGINLFSDRPYDYDLSVYSEYENMDDVDKALAHPAHDELLAFMNKVMETGCSVTYEV